MPDDRDALHRRLLKSGKYAKKPAATRRLILDSLEILGALGVPVNASPRKLECMGMAFLAVANVRRGRGWSAAEGASARPPQRTRDIIKYVNEHFTEAISSGSYDDVRRKHLRLAVEAHVVSAAAQDAARNDPSRGYFLSDAVARTVRCFRTPEWPEATTRWKSKVGDLANELAARRDLALVPVTLPDGATLSLTAGPHNRLQKAIIEEFLPRFGHDAVLLYVGDAADKALYVAEAQLRELRFFDLAHGELPDVVALARGRNWLFLIEAVYSSGPIDPLRRRRLVSLTRDCTAPVVFVTAFPDRRTFRRFVADLAWEQEVWIAAEPDHLIHLNGGRFLGPYAKD